VRRQRILATNGEESFTADNILFRVSYAGLKDSLEKHSSYTQQRNIVVSLFNC